LKHVKVAVTSVLEQTHADWEMVIADDGSAEDTREYLRCLDDPRIRTLWLPHSGSPSRVRNAAIRSARGTYLAFLDSDDRWDPRKLEVQLSALQAEPGRRWSYTAMERVDEQGRPKSDEGIALWAPYEGNIVEKLLRIEAIVATPTVIAERSLVEEAGGFDEDQWFGEDYDLWIRLAMRSEVGVVAQRLASVGVHEDNYSRNRLGAYEGWVRLYGKMAGILPDPRLRALARRRGAESILALARLQVDARHRLAAWRTLMVAAPRCWAYSGWSREAARTIIRAGLPQEMRDSYRRPRKHR
jgi:glycosyltransferase involved in cell wall biosynthesis